jgi:hypothetical protein
MENVKKYQSHQQKCELLLQDPEIRFAGLLDPLGNLVAGGFKTGVEQLKDENETKKMFIEAVLRQRTREEFDYNLGPVQYGAARRKNAVIMSFPIGKNVLFTAAEPFVEIDKTARKIMKIYGI